MRAHVSEKSRRRRFCFITAISNTVLFPAFCSCAPISIYSHIYAQGIWIIEHGFCCANIWSAADFLQSWLELSVTCAAGHLLPASCINDFTSLIKVKSTPEDSFISAAMKVCFKWTDICFKIFSLHFKCFLPIEREMPLSLLDFQFFLCVCFVCLLSIAAAVRPVWASSAAKSGLARHTVVSLFWSTRKHLCKIPTSTLSQPSDATILSISGSGLRSQRE